MVGGVVWCGVVWCGVVWCGVLTVWQSAVAAAFRSPDDPWPSSANLIDLSVFPAMTVTQVLLQCPGEGVSMASTNHPDGSSTTRVACGQKFQPRPCFPFC